MEIAFPAGTCVTVAAAAAIPRIPGVAKRPASFRIAVVGRWLPSAYARLTYPIAPGVALIAPATPPFPTAPWPVGNEMDVPAPMVFCHCAFVFARYEVNA